MPILIGVSFKRAGKVYFFDPGPLELSMGDMVVVETARGRELGRVCTKPQNVEESEVVAPLKTVMRKATEEDSDTFFQNRLKSTEAFRICNDKIHEHKLPMKLIDVEYTLDSSKAIFYFSAEGRIDFRNLVRDLAAVFKKRIELHQIGVRDEAKLIGGLGPCGRPVCCASFMTEFDPVSIKMAKEQNLSLNPERISGTCGRLMCCLKHEHVFYHETLKEMPDLGSTIELPDGRATVVELSVPKRCVIVELANNVRLELPAEKLPPKKCHRKCREDGREDGGEKRQPRERAEDGRSESGDRRQPRERAEDGGDRRQPRERAEESRSESGDRRQPRERAEDGGDRRQPREQAEDGGDRRQPREQTEDGGDRRQPGERAEDGGDRRQPGEQAEDGEDRRQPREQAEDGGDRRQPGEQAEDGGDRRQPGERIEDGGDRERIEVSGAAEETKAGAEAEESREAPAADEKNSD